MSHRCPVCKARLWTDSLLIPSRLSCPRCGAEFRTTVYWGYLRVLLVVVVPLVIFVIFSFSEYGIWILAFLIGAAILYWILQRFFHLQHISDLPILEGPADLDTLELRLEDQQWGETYRKAQGRRKLRQIGYLFLVVALVCFFLFVIST